MKVCTIFLIMILLAAFAYAEDDLKHNQYMANQLDKLINQRLLNQQANKDDISDQGDENNDKHQNDTNNHDGEGQNEEGHHHLTPSDQQFWQYVLISIFLTATGAFCSGMTVGLLSISTLELEMMTMKKNEKQSKMAKMILSVVSNHHLFLVTLLIANAMALQSLPLMVHNLMPDWAAILFSTFIVLVVAEIIPQAYCTGPKKILLAYYASPLILVMIKIFWVIAYPVAKGLDYLLGVHQHERIQHKDFATFLNDDKFLKETEKMLLTSTLQLRGERVHTVMIPVNQFFMIQEKQYLTEQMVKQIKQKDYSYILTYKEKRNKISGIIKIKQFALKYLKENKRDMKAEEILKSNSNLLTVYSDTNLLEMLMLFQAKATRIALVCNLKRKIDPTIQSIMYSKSDMVYSESTAKQAEVSGVIFLYQIFQQMAHLKQKIERQSQFERQSQRAYLNKQSNYQRELTTLKAPLVDRK